MLKLERLLWKESVGHHRATAKEKLFAENVFREWRDRYVATLCANIRVHRFAHEAGIPLPPTIPTMQWSNAAIHVLTISNESVQDWFLRSSPQVKTRVVNAVLTDGGITNPNGTFIELPPL